MRWERKRVRYYGDNGWKDSEGLVLEGGFFAIHLYPNAQPSCDAFDCPIGDDLVEWFGLTHLPTGKALGPPEMGLLELIRFAEEMQTEADPEALASNDHEVASTMLQTWRGVRERMAKERNGEAA